jgi:hypothetical protein
MSSTINRVNLGKVKGKPLATNIGATDDGTLRVVLSDESQVGIDPNDNTVKLDVTKGSGSTDSQTIRTVTATNSPEITAFGATNETAPATDTATSGINGRLQRIAQRLSTLIAGINIAQIAGNSISTGTGAATTGTQRVAVAQDSKIIPHDGTNAITVKAASTASVATDTAEVVAIHPSSNTVQIGAAFNAGTASATTLRTVVSSNSPDVVALGDSTDVTIPATSSAAATVKGLLRFIANLINPTVSTLGGFGIVDLALTGSRTRSFQITNNTAAIIFVQVHNKATALVTGDVPLNGYSVRLPANSSYSLGAGDLGMSGTSLSTNTRIGLSSTFATYTAITPTNTSIFAMVVS